MYIGALLNIYRCVTLIMFNFKLNTVERAKNKVQKMCDIDVINRDKLMFEYSLQRFNVDEEQAYNIFLCL